MKDKISDIKTLTSYINRMRFDSMDDEIALWLYENRYRLRHYSLKKLAESGYFSQASISRFLKKNGEEDYPSYKINLAESLATSHELDDLMLNPIRGMETGEVVDQTVEQMIDSLQMLKELDARKLQYHVRSLSCHRHVYFFGTESTTQIFSFLQASLTNNGINAYILFDPIGQKRILERVKDEDLIVVISSIGQWYLSPDGSQIVEAIQQKHCQKLLWTLKKDHPDAERFDDVLSFGDLHKVPYMQMFTFSMILSKLFLQYNLAMES